MSNVVRLEYAYGVCPKCKSVHYLRYLIHNDGLIHKPYEIKCINCNSYFTKEDILGRGEETEPKPITNADRIRAMTDEELAEFFGTLPCCPPGEDVEELCFPLDSCEGTDLMVKCWLKWMRQEAT